MPHETKRVTWRELEPGDYVRDATGRWYFLTGGHGGRFDAVDEDANHYRLAQPSSKVVHARISNDEDAMRILSSVLGARSVEGRAIVPPIHSATDPEHIRSHLEHLHGIKIEAGSSTAYLLVVHARDENPMIAHVHRSL